MRGFGAAVVAVAVLLSQPVLAQDEPPIVTDARAFMAAYADDLRLGRREAVVARYDPPVWFARGGRVETVDGQALARGYAEGSWSAPAAFEWIDLTYIPTGTETVSVIGRFRWTGASGDAALYSYHGLMVQTDGGLRIRIEDETPIPSP